MANTGKWTLRQNIKPIGGQWDRKTNEYNSEAEARTAARRIKRNWAGRGLCVLTLISPDSKVTQL